MKCPEFGPIYENNLTDSEVSLYLRNNNFTGNNLNCPKGYYIQVSDSYYTARHFDDCP